MPHLCNRCANLFFHLNYTQVGNQSKIMYVGHEGRQGDHPVIPSYPMDVPGRRTAERDLHGMIKKGSSLWFVKTPPKKNNPCGMSPSYQVLEWFGLYPQLLNLPWGAGCWCYSSYKSTSAGREMKPNTLKYKAWESWEVQWPVCGSMAFKWITRVAPKCHAWNRVACSHASTGDPLLPCRDGGSHCTEA